METFHFCFAFLQSEFLSFDWTNFHFELCQVYSGLCWKSVNETWNVSKEQSTSWSRFFAFEKFGDPTQNSNFSFHPRMCSSNSLESTSMHSLGCLCVWVSAILSVVARVQWGKNVKLLNSKINRVVMWSENFTQFTMSLVRLLELSTPFSPSLARLSWNAKMSMRDSFNSTRWYRKSGGKITS